MAVSIKKEVFDLLGKAVLPILFPLLLLSLSLLSFGPFGAVIIVFLAII